MNNLGVAIENNGKFVSNSKTKSNIVADHFANKLFSKISNPPLNDIKREDETLQTIFIC